MNFHSPFPLFFAALTGLALSPTHAQEAPEGNDLAKQLANPVASLISVPFQSNWDFGIGVNDASRYTMNFQPVIPLSLDEDWNLIIRTIVPGETLRPMQKVSIACAALGVILQIIALGTFPWIGLILALSMAFYGLARRRSELGSLSGLATETLVFLPLAAGYLIWSSAEGRELWGRQDFHDLTCIGILGIVTAIPLLGFAHAARKLPFSLLGVLQFLAPTGQFLTGVFVYHEPFTMRSLASFACIWIGVGLFCVDLWRSERNPRSNDHGFSRNK